MLGVRRGRKALSATFVVGLVAAVVVVLAGPAAAAGGDGSAGADTRIVTTIERAPDIARPAGLRVGGSLTRVMEGAVVTYFAPTRTCTQSITARTPYKSSGNAVAEVKFYNSSGCGNEWTVARMYREACGLTGCNWRIDRDMTGTVYAGTTVTRVMLQACLNSNSDRYQSGGSWDALYYTRSSIVWLACGR